MSRLMTFRLFRGRTYCFGSKSGTSPPKGARQGRVVEQRQPPNAAAAFAESRPKSLLPDTNRADDSHAGNDNVLRRCHICETVLGNNAANPLS